MVQIIVVKKRVVIVHCWDGYPEYCWYASTKTQLEIRGFQVDVPSMPDSSTPKLSSWLPKLKEVAGEANENLFLVGHSLGCITILKYLETLDEFQEVGGVVLVAGFTDDLGFEELKNFFENDLDFEKIKTKANKFVVINSDDDPYVPLKYGYILQENLSAKLIIKHGMKHFSGGEDNQESCINLPDVAEVILKML